MPGPILLPAAEREARAWKNGAGLTRDVISMPPGSGLEDFGWRLSIAEVDADGPFSIFEGVQRHMLVLAGSLELQGPGVDKTLRAGGPPFAFSGEIPVHGSPLDGPVRDLNLMVRIGQFDGELATIHSGIWRSGDADTVIVAPGSGTVTVDGARFDLAADDALLLPGGATIAHAMPLMVATVRQRR